MRLRDFDALTFDCYGTLVDWESGILEGLRPLLSRVDPAPSPDRALEAHARLEALTERLTPTKPYSGVLAVVYKRLAEEWGAPAPWDECVAYGRSIARWPAFEDTVESLRYLQGHYKLVILSNIDNASFEATREKLGVRFDAVCTAEDIGSYKPDLRNFEYLLDHLRSLGVARNRVLHVAESLFHDHEPANHLGLASAWIHRRHGREGFGATRAPDGAPRHDFRFTSLAELVAAHRAEA